MSNRTEATLGTVPARDSAYVPRAPTTFENTLEIWLPMVSRMTITTIETKTKIKAYSTIPCPT